MVSKNGAIAFLTLVYCAGAIGIQGQVHPGFILLTPLNLVFSLVLALAFHPGWTASLTRFLAASFALGFGAELFGVQTGILFGEYAYGTVLGPKLWGTPVVIGVNWMLVSYTAGMLVNALAPRWHWSLRAVAGALLLVGLDLFIEPVAIAHGFWYWEGGNVPLRNYLGWFAVALPLQAFFALAFAGKQNKVAAALFILQFLFFLVLGLFIS